MDFERWKALPPVENLAKSLSFDAELAQCKDWDEYANRFTAANGDEGRLIEAARKLSKTASTGEISVLAAMLHAGDYSHVADEISQVGVWSRLERTCGDHAEAVALAIMRS